MDSLFRAIAEKKLLPVSPLLRLHRSMDWARVRGAVAFLYEEIRSRKGGQSPYDPLAMARVLLLQRWHGLSDPKTEEALMIRLDFTLFAGFDVDTPDATTINRFRSRLKRAGKLEELFGLAQEAIEASGFELIPTDGAVMNIRLRKSM